MNSLALGSRDMNLPNDLVERYIAAVKFWLPAHLRDDVAAELADDIRSEIEEAEKAKGRPLTGDEVATILKARGNPLAVATRYQPQRSLIGPELFPLYIFVLKIVAVICFIPPVLAWFSRLVIDHSAPVPGMISSPFNSLLVAFAIVTIVFAVIEHKGINITKKNDWNPKALRPVFDRNRIRRSDSGGEIIGPMIGSGFLSRTTYDFANGGSITVAPEWIPFWQIMIGLAFAEMALAAVNLFKPYWSGLRVVAWLVLNLAKTAAFCWLFQSHIIRDITGLPAHAAAQFQMMSDKAADYALPIFGLIAFILIAKALWRILRTITPRPAAV
jgi:hypothetical protein